MKRQILIISILALSTLCTAQTEPTTPTTKHTWQGFFEQLTDYDDIDNGNLEELYDIMCELESSPIDLNSATDDDIQRLTFLNDEQREQLTEYLDRYRPLRSMGEIAMISSMDPLRMQLMRNFTYISEENRERSFPSINDILKYGKNEIVATTKVPFYNRKGDYNGYLGYKYKHWTRYKFQYGQYLQIGLLGTQDAGEPFFSNKNSMGYDHYAYYAIIRNLGRLKTLVAGQYKLRFGLGLAMNTGFNIGKTTSLTMSTPANSITTNSSRSDAYYLQGVATTISVNPTLDLTAFASYRKIDATLNEDGSIKTILKTGYHRTDSEMQRKQNATQTTTGANLKWHNGGWHAGVSGIFTSFNKPLNPNTSQIFRKYNPAGKNFYNASVNYGYLSHMLNINGETAINNKGAIATLNSISFKFSSSLRLTAIQRFYSYRYYSLFSSSFSDGGNIQNESGIYIGANWSPLSHVSILAYSDYAYYPWARYGVSNSSHAWDHMLQTTYSISSCMSLIARYRLRLRQVDNKSANKPNDNNYNKNELLIDKKEHRGRIALIYNDNKLTAKTQADVAYTTFPYNTRDKENSFGWMLSQTASYDFGKIYTGFNFGYFHTHDYNSRLYTYERGTLYTFSFPMFYGKGMRAAFFLKGNVGNNLIIIGKIGTTKYFDRDKISSSLQEIDASSQTDLDLQIKWKF